jgi:hypothetical protein
MPFVNWIASRIKITNGIEKSTVRRLGPTEFPCAQVEFPAEVRPLKFLGKAVPRVVVEFAEPWKSVAEFGPRKEWSG